MPHVPGTVILNEESAHTESLTGGLKHGSGRNSNIILAPQPSEDPNDPLNWSAFKKEYVTYILLFGSILNAATNGPFLNASYVVIANDVNYPLNDVVLVSGYNLLAAGASGPIWCALSRRYGKRPCFLASTLFDIIGTAVGEAGVSYPYLLAARIIQGFSTSAYESLIVASVGDLYFVHQRGLRIAIINWVLNSVSCLTSIILGQVTAGLGWRWLFHMFQIFLVVQFILNFLFAPETTYIRDSSYDIDQNREENLEELVKTEHQREHRDMESGGIEKVTTTQSSSVRRPIPAKKTFVQELAVYTGVYSRDNILKYILGPFITLLNPAALYCTVTSGLLNAWYVGTAIIAAGIFSSPPYNFGPSGIANIGIGPFIGGIIGSTVIALTSDPAAKWLTRMNKGI
jgi:MFS family permease